MNRIEFMRQLEYLLQSLPPTEREEALQFYNDYFDDAGAENEQSVIDALGNPAKVAESIKKEFSGSGYGENPYQRASKQDRAMIEYGTVDESRDRYSEKAAQNNTWSQGAQTARNDAWSQGAQTARNNAWSSESQNVQRSPVASTKKLPAGIIVLLIVLGIVASPVLLSVIATLFGVLAGVLITWIALIFGFGVTAVVLLAVMIGLMVLGIRGLFLMPLGGVGLLGGGLLCGGIGLLFLSLTLAMAGVVTPAVFRGIATLCRKLFRPKRAYS